MPYSKPILQSSRKRLYDPIRGRRVIDEHKGFFKNTARQLGISGLLGIDPKSQSGLFINKPVEAYYDASTHLNHFLDQYQGITQKDIQIVTDGSHKKYVQIGNGMGAKHQLNKYGREYFIKTRNHFLKYPMLPLKIVANNDQEMLQKLTMLFTSPVARAKLTLKSPIIPLLHGDILKPGHGQYIALVDSKIIPNSYPQEFDSTDAFTVGNEFDSALGGISGSQINYHLSDNYSGPYSDKPADKPFETVQDAAWLRINAMTEHLLSSTLTDELLGNIINMYDTDKTMTPEQRSQTVEKLREDYIYNLNGKGSINSRQRDETPASYAYDIKDNNIWKQFKLAANPIRGGRIWRDVPFSLEQTVRAFYKSSADGKRIFKYDIDPQKFKNLIKKMSVKPTDRQFIASHGRKILGAYVALKLLSDEIAHIPLHDTKIPPQQRAYNEKKWHDLNQLQDMLFESTGDLRDFMRQSTGSYSQLKDTVSQHIPKLVNNNNIAQIKQASRDKSDFIAQSKHNLFNHIQNYTYLEDILGWHARERIGSWIYKDLVTKVYEKPVSKVRGATAAIVLLEGIDTLSRQLKYVENSFQAAVDGKTAFKNMIDKIKYGDIKGVNSFLKWNVNRLFNGLTGEKNYPEYKLQALESEGVIMEDLYLSPQKKTYLGENQGFFFGNPPSSRTSWLYADLIKKDLVEFMQLCGIHIKKIQAEMQHKNLKDMYQTDALKTLEHYIREAGDVMAMDYLEDKKEIFQTLKPDEAQKLHHEISKKMYHFLQTAVNVSGLLANAPDVVYR